MPRLFTAITLPERERDALAGLEAPLRGARWLDPHDYHITLRFLGDIPAAAANAFLANLRSLSETAVTLRLSGLGAFGGSRPRTIWAGLVDETMLRPIQAMHEAAARSADLEPETRRYHPHVTLARLGGTRAKAVAEYLGQFGGYRGEAFTVRSFALMSARPGRGGGPYVVEEEIPFDFAALNEIDPEGEHQRERIGDG